MTATTATRSSLYLSQDADFDRLSALEFGAIDDGQPGDRWVGVGEQVGLLHDAPGGRCVGFLVLELSEYDPDADEYAQLWDAPRFDVPALGLTDVAPNEIVVATRALFGEQTTVNRTLFRKAMDADGELALHRWLRCLQAGDSMAHYGLGYSLYSLGRHQEAYRHLRHYAGIAPGEAWTWAYYARAAAAIGETVEARTALARAIELDEDDEAGARTDAQELLEELDAGTFAAPERVLPRDPAARATELIERLSAEIGKSLIAGFSDTHVTVLVELGQPVWVSVGLETGDVLIRSQIGTIHEEDFGEDAVDDLLQALGHGDHNRALDPDGNDIYLHYDFRGLFPDLQIPPGLLRPLVVGAAVCAVQKRDLGPAHGIRILMPRNAADEYRLRTGFEADS